MKRDSRASVKMFRFVVRDPKLGRIPATAFGRTKEEARERLKDRVGEVEIEDGVRQ